MWRPHGKTLVRVGEATNPGPAAGNGQPTVRLGAAVYAHPGQPGFRHHVLPSPEGARQGQDRAHFELIVETLNGTAWGPISRYLLATTAQLLLVQEHHLGPSEAAAASAYALHHGWQPLILPAAPGEGDGWRGGVAIFARWSLRLLPPRVGPYEIIPARAIAAVVEAPGYRPFTAVAVYLEHGKGVGVENMSHMQEIGCFLDAQGAQVPFIVGGDFQSDPDDAARMGFARRSGGSLVAARDPRGTCRSPLAVSEIDFFYVHDAMTTGLAEVTVVEGAGTAPHVPVRLRFHARQTSARALMLRRPQRIGVERIYGPLPEGPCWAAVTAASRNLLAKVRDGGFAVDDQMRGEYSELYAGWADLAEQEIMEATGSVGEIRKTGLRGREPVLVWRAVQPERPPPPPPHQVELARWRTRLTILQELRGVLQWLIPVASTAGAAPREDRAPTTGPVPAHARRDTGTNVIEKLRAIRAQIDEDDDGGREATRAADQVSELNEDVPGDHDLGDAEALRRLRILVCGAELAARVVPVDQGSGPGVTRLSPLLRRLNGAADDVLELFQRRLRRAAAAERAARIDGWRQWVTQNLDNGARNAHKYLRIPGEWRPSTTLTVDGVVTADPQALLAGYAAKYDRLWNDAARARRERRGQQQAREPPQRGSAESIRKPHGEEPPWRRGRSEPLPRPTPSELRDTASSFSKETVVAFDGIALRHYPFLSDAALSVVADIIEVVETVGEFPSQLYLTEMPMIGKPRGGHRAVASLVSLYRLWAKLRKPVVTEWEVSNDRPYLAAGKGRTPQGTVWRQASRAEAAVSEGRHAGTLLWDMAAFFESVKREPLWHRAKKLLFPLAILRAALIMYESARILSLGGAITAPMEAEDGILAGCGFAMALTRAYVISPLDVAVASFGPRSALPATTDMYVDDLALAAEGTMREVVDRLSHAAGVLQRVIEGELDCRIELEKAAVVSSHPVLTKMLINRFGELAGPAAREHRPRTRGGPGVARRGARGARSGLSRTLPRWRLDAAAVNLGVDFAAGQPRRLHGRGSKRAVRLGRLKQKAVRMQRIRSVVGKRMPTIFCAGPLPEAVYGAAVNGMSDAEVLTLRRCAAQAYTPRARGRSLSRLLLLVGVPTWRAEVEVILEYSRQVWQASLLGADVAEDGTLSLAQLSRMWHAVSTKEILPGAGDRRNWAAVRGPIGAAWLSLHRIGWTMSGPFTLRDHDGEELVLTTTTPALLAQLLKHAVMRTLQSQVGTKLAERDDNFRGRRAAAEHVASQLRGDRKLTCKDRACYMSVACGAVMTFARAAAAGYLVENLCPLCGARGDTIVHRVWRCQHPDAVAAREAAVPKWLLQEFHRAVEPERNAFWSTAFIPHPADIWPAPISTAEMQYEWVGEELPGGDDRAQDGRPLLHGSLYVDGSCTTGVFAELRRASMSIVQWEATRPAGWRMEMPVPRPLPQTPQAAEYGALALVKRFAHPTRAAAIASDCANVVRDARAPPRIAMAGRRTYAGLLKEALTDPSWRRRAEVRKVPAHINPESLPDGRAKNDAIGNGMADERAKAARAGHPAVPPAMVQDLDATLRRARYVVRAIAKVMQCYSPMPRERMQRPPLPREGARIGIGDGHKWVHAGGIWRCEDCLRITTKPNVSGHLAHQRCPGARPSMDAAALTANGHTMAQTGGMVPILFCVKCGSWSTRRAFGLAARCRGRPTPAGQQALVRIMRGLQPWEDHRDGPGARRRGTAPCERMWSSADGAFISRSAQRAEAGACGKRRRAHGSIYGDGTGAQDGRARSGRRRSDDSPATDAAAAGHRTDDGGAVDGPQPSTRDLVLRAPIEYEDVEDDVFGHGGSLDQEEPAADGYSRVPGAYCSWHGDGDGALWGARRAGASQDGAGQRSVRPRIDQADNFLMPAEAAGGRIDDGELGGGARGHEFRTDAERDEVDVPMSDVRRGDGCNDDVTENRHRIRLQINGASGVEPRRGAAAHGRLETNADARQRPGEVVQERVEAIDALQCVVVAREGPGDPNPSALTVAAAGRPAAPAAATVALGADAILLSTDDSIAGPPDGAAAPSDDSKPSAVRPHGREVYLNPLVMPVVEGGGGPRMRSVYSSPQSARGSRRAGLREGEAEMGRTRATPPSRSIVRRRVGNDDPVGGPPVARCGSAATGAADSEQPQRGCADRTGMDARSGCDRTGHTPSRGGRETERREHRRRRNWERQQGGRAESVGEAAPEGAETLHGVRACSGELDGDRLRWKRARINGERRGPEQPGEDGGDGRHGAVCDAAGREADGHGRSSHTRSCLVGAEDVAARVAGDVAVGDLPMGDRGGQSVDSNNGQLHPDRHGAEVPRELAPPPWRLCEGRHADEARRDDRRSPAEAAHRHGATVWGGGMASTDSVGNGREGSGDGSGSHNSGTAGRGVKRAATTPRLPVPEQPPRQRARGPRCARDRRDDGGGGRLVRQRGEQRAASGASPMSSSGWLMPWERRPSWEYLPHLSGASADAPLTEAGNESENGQGAAVDTQWRPPASACVVRRKSSGMATNHGPAVRREVVGADSVERGAGSTCGPPPGAQPATAIGGTGGRGCQIRGRDISPGRGHRTSGGGGCASAAAAVIRGQTAVPGPNGDSGISEAQARLDLRNAALARSLADHAERVERKSASHAPRDTLTAQERLEALRRRVALRQTAAGSGDGALDARTGSASAAGSAGRGGRGHGRGALERTIEVPKIHLTHRGDGQHVNSGQSMGGCAGDAASGSGDMVPSADDGAQRDSASDAAASHVAWHTAAGGARDLQRLGGRALNS